MTNEQMNQIAQYAVRGMDKAERDVFCSLVEEGEIGFAKILVEIGALRIVNRNIEMANMALSCPETMRILVQEVAAA